MKQSTSFAQVATNLLNVLQGCSKSIRLLLVMFLTLTVCANVWGASIEINYGSSTTGWTIKDKEWSTKYWGLCNETEYCIISPNFDDLSVITSVKVTARTYGNTSGNSNKIGVYGNATRIGTQQTATTTFTEYTFTPNDLSGKGVITIQSDGTTTGAGLRVTKIIIEYNDSPKDPCTITYEASLGTPDKTSEETTSSVTLPNISSIDCGDWDFAGWATASIEITNETPNPLYVAGSTYTPSSDITLYAVYKRTETSGDAFAGYEKVNEDLDDWSGKYLLSTGTYTATGSYSSNHLPRTTYTPSSEEKNEWEFTLTKVGNVGYSILFPDGSWYLGWKDGTDFVRSTEDPSENIKYLWTPSINGISNVSATTRKIADNGSADFRPYSSPSSGTVYLYKRVGGSSTTYYHSTPECTTEPTVCLIQKNRYFYSLFF